MKRNKIIFKLLIFLVLASAYKTMPAETNINYREEMRKFVKEISRYTKNKKDNFYIVPQNGQELAIQTNGTKIESEYIKSIDAIGREDLFFGYNADNKKTPGETSKYLTSLCDIFKKYNKPVFVTDYCSTIKNIDFSYLQNKKQGYISYACDNRNLSTIPKYPKKPYNQNTADVKTLRQVKNFLYLINDKNYKTKKDFIIALKNTHFDLLIIDLFSNDEEFTKDEINQLKIKKDGGIRIVLCYLSIGEAEDYRYYWQPAWKENKPEWLKSENPEWKGNYKTEYWNTDWKAIIYGSENSYLDKILSSGFDGVYLDIIDAFEYFEQ